MEGEDLMRNAIEPLLKAFTNQKQAKDFLCNGKQAISCTMVTQLGEAYA